MRERRVVNSGPEGRPVLRVLQRGAVAAFFLLLAALPIVALLGSWRWNANTGTLAERLRALPSPPAAAGLSPAVTDDEIAALPPPVARYLRAVLPPGVRPVTEARFRWRGDFRTAPGEKGWHRFQAEQLSRVAPAGFVWNATVSTNVPGVGVFARDAFVGGEGGTAAAVLGLYPLADAGGTAAAAAASLQRHLAESVWFPTALLPRCGVRWEPIDGGSARATLASGGVAASLDFRFGADGLVESVHSSSRSRLVDGRAVPTPWEGRMAGYGVRDGMRVPLSGEAAWLLPEGRLPYWKGELSDVAYEREG